MDRQQLDGGDAEVLEVVHDGRVSETGVGPAQLLGRPVVQGGEALDVQLVDRGVAPAGPDLDVVAPVEVVVDDHAAPDVRRGVALVAGAETVHGAQVVVDLVAVDRGVGGELAADGPGVGVEQELVGVEPQTLGGGPGPVDPVAVALTGLEAGQGAVPDAAADLGQGVAGLDLVGPLALEEAHPHRRRVGGVHGEVGGLRAPGRAEGPVAARPHVHALADGRPLPWSHRPRMPGPRGSSCPNGDLHGSPAGLG